MHYFDLWQSNWPHHCFYNHNLQLLSWLHCLSSNFIMTAIIGLLVSDGWQSAPQQTSTAVMLCHLSQWCYLHQPLLLGSVVFGAENRVIHANSHEVLMCLPWTLVAMGLQWCSCQLSSLNKTTLVCGNGNGYTSAIMINTTNTFYGYSLGIIASPTILSSLLPLISLYPMAEYGSCNNHQEQQWCVTKLVVTAYISLFFSHQP
jgi:hypothetical protein